MAAPSQRIAYTAWVFLDNLEKLLPNINDITELILTYFLHGGWYVPRVFVNDVAAVFKMIFYDSRPSSDEDCRVMYL
jgi:hypothetical protein